MSQGCPPREATLVTAAAGFLVLGAAASATVDPSTERAARTREPGSTASPLAHFADTIDRASFTLALEKA